VLQPDPSPRHSESAVDFDLSPLHKYILEPHFLAPLAVDTSSAIQDLIPPFTKTKPTPIPPYTFILMQNKLLTHYTRGAWVIPILGALPWEVCTPATVIRPPLTPTPSLYPSSPALNYIGKPAEITWTRTSLLAFWTFLLQTREARKLGHISLSFHPCSRVPHCTSPDISLDLRSQRTDGRKSLLSTDHFKIYCDVEFALYVRSVLDAWFLDWHQIMSYEDTAGYRMEAIKPKKVRPLEGAKLAFVDEGSQGLFIS